MENIYRVLPNCIPPEIQRLIHLFAGTCTPSCKFIKLYIGQLNDDSYISRTDTLWCTLMSEVLCKNFSWSRGKNMSPDQVLDLQIAFTLCSRDRYVRMCDADDKIHTAKVEMWEAFMKSVRKIKKEQTVRVHEKYRKCLEEDLLEDSKSECDRV